MRINIFNNIYYTLSDWLAVKFLLDSSEASKVDLQLLTEEAIAIQT
jgi:hypothetical protein